MDINQVYKAPSVPKLSKKNISSSVLRGAATPKLKTTKFSFVKPKLSTETLKTDTSALKVSETLVETNRILVEIQNQLSLDFAMRIAEEKEELKKIKAAESKRKFAGREADVESTTKKIGSALGGAVQRLTSPVKSVFDRIKEFFSLILIGIVYNKAFNWLQDENNKNLLFTIFDWIGNSFVPVLIGIVTYKLIKWGYRLFKIGRWFWRLPGRLRSVLGFGPRLPGTGSGSGPGSGSKPSGPAKPSPRLTKPKGSGPVPRPRPPKPILSPSGQPLGSPLSPYIGAGATRGQAPGIPKPGAGIKPKPTPNIKPGMFGGMSASIARNLGRFLRVLGLGLLAVEISEDWKKGDYKAVAVKLTASGLGWLVAALIATKGAFLTGTGVGAPAGVPLIAGSLAGGYATEMGTRALFGYKGGGTIRASNGMTVPGRGSGNVDSVRAMLAPGEEVIKTTSAMLFRPLLKDINDNAGRLWAVFSIAIKKLLSITKNNKEVTEELRRSVDKLNRAFKEDIAKKKFGTGASVGGGGYGSTKATPSSVNVIPKNTRMVQQAPAGRRSSLPMGPIVLPTQRGNTPKVPHIAGPETKVQYVSPFNDLNPWMEISSEIYGIMCYTV